MKRDEVKKILGDNASDEIVESIMEAYGKGVERAKTAAETAKAEADALKAQLAEAGQTIESFKALKPDELKAAADEWKTKFEQAQTEAAAQLQKVKFDHALERELKETYKVKDPRDVIPNLKLDAVKFSDAGFEGLKDQIEPLKESKNYLFADTVEPPRVVSGGNNQSVASDAVVEIARKAAGLKPAS